MGDMSILLSQIINGVVIMIVAGAIATAVVIALVAVIAYKVYKSSAKRKREKEKAEETERILKTDVKSMADEIADKYNK